MVSPAADSQIPYSQRRASASFSLPSNRAQIRSQRSHARSMRTVRSNLYGNDNENENAEAPHRDSSPAISENLSDSVVVDFRLRELAVCTASSKPASFDHLLDLDFDFSHDFSSDYHSFCSDISGELHRLASVPTPPRRDNPSSDDGDGDRDRDDPVGLGFDASWVESIVSSSEILETAAPDSLEPAVRACVEVLQSSAAHVEAKRTAAAKLRLLAKHRSDFRAMIGASGAIPALVPLLRSTDPAAQENAVTALLNLSLEEGNKAPITAAGAIKPLVYALRTGTEAAKQNAACALLSLSMIEENRASIGACGAIPPLVSLLVGGSSRGKKDALTTLYKLCSARQNKERAVRAGVVAPLVALVGERGSGTTEKAMVVLSSLAGIAEGREAIVEAGGIPALVEAIEDGSSSHGQGKKGKELAVVALLQLCADSPSNRGLLVREGAIPPLVALSQSAAASARAKQKAETLLGYLREQRQQDSSVCIGLPR